MSEYYAVTRCDKTLQHWGWGKSNPNAKEKEGHKYVARYWVDGQWRYFYTQAEYDAFLKNRQKAFVDNLNAKRKNFMSSVSARLYNATEDFKDWSGINAASELKRARAEVKTATKYRDQARSASSKARAAYRTAEANSFKYAPQYKARYSEKSKAFYKANARAVSAKRYAYSAMSKYGKTPIGAAHNAVRSGIQAIARIFRKG